MMGGAAWVEGRGWEGGRREGCDSWHCPDIETKKERGRHGITMSWSYG